MRGTGEKKGHLYPAETLETTGRIDKRGTGEKKGHLYPAEALKTTGRIDKRGTGEKKGRLYPAEALKTTGRTDNGSYLPLVSGTQTVICRPSHLRSKFCMVRVR